MRTALSLLPLAFVGTAYAAAVSSRSSSGDCNALWDKAPSLLADLEVYVAEDLPGSFSSSSPQLHLLTLSLQPVPTSPQPEMRTLLRTRAFNSFRWVFFPFF